MVVSWAVYHWSDAWCLPLSDSQQWLYLSVSVLHWEASILGPVSLWRCIFSDFNTSIVQQGNFLTCVDCWQEDSPYHGGRFWLRIDFTADYPFRPPKVQWQFLWYLYFSVCWLNLGVQLLICIVHVNDKFFNFHFIWQIIFLTKVFHPNVEPDGKICIDFLQDEWKPSYTIGYRKCWMELFFNLLMHINLCTL